MTITITTTDDKTLGCCPCIPSEGPPTVLVVMTSGSSCMRARLTAESAQRLGHALSQAGNYLDPHSANWHDRQQRLMEELAE